MDEEDLPSNRKPAPLKDLTLLGIAELEEYIAALEGERCVEDRRSVSAPGGDVNGQPLTWLG